MGEAYRRYQHGFQRLISRHVLESIYAAQTLFSFRVCHRRKGRCFPSLISFNSALKSQTLQNSHWETISIVFLHSPPMASRKIPNILERPYFSSRQTIHSLRFTPGLLNTTPGISPVDVASTADGVSGMGLRLVMPAVTVQVKIVHLTYVSSPLFSGPFWLFFTSKGRALAAHIRRHQPLQFWHQGQLLPHGSYVFPSGYY